MESLPYIVLVACFTVITINEVSFIVCYQDYYNICCTLYKEWKMLDDWNDLLEEF